jgi:hypothetical protein
MSTHTCMMVIKSYRSRINIVQYFSDFSCEAVMIHKSRDTFRAEERHQKMVLRLRLAI